MIIRVFRSTIHPGKESEFESFLRETAMPLVSQQSGIVAQHVGSLLIPLLPSSCTSLSGRTSTRSGRLPANAGRRPSSSRTRSTSSRTPGSSTTRPSKNPVRDDPRGTRTHSK
jgi:hypothetical protein